MSGSMLGSMPEVVQRAEIPFLAIKRPNTKTANSQKFMNNFAPYFARLFNTTVQGSTVSCCIYLRYTEMTKTSNERTNFSTEQTLISVSRLVVSCVTSKTIHL